LDKRNKYFVKKRGYFLRSKSLQVDLDEYMGGYNKPKDPSREAVPGRNAHGNVSGWNKALSGKEFNGNGSSLNPANNPGVSGHCQLKSCLGQINPAANDYVINLFEI